MIRFKNFMFIPTYLRILVTDEASLGHADLQPSDRIIADTNPIV